MSSRTLAWLRWALSWTLVVVVVALAVRVLDWRRTLDSMRTARLSWLGLAVLANGCILLLWGRYWLAISPRNGPVRYGRMLEIVSVTSAVMNTVPFGAGHATGAVLLARRGGMTAHGALNVVALDQLGEGVAKTTVYLLVALLAPLPPWMHTGIALAAGGVAMLLTVLLFAAHWYADHPTERAVYSDTRIGRAREFVARWAAGLETLRSWRRSGVALAWALGMKCAEFGGVLCTQAAFGLHLGFGGALLVMAALVLGTMLPLAPGNVGTYEATVFLAYRYLGLTPEVAAAVAVVQHACFLLPIVGGGYAGLAWRSLRTRAASS